MGNIKNERMLRLKIRRVLKVHGWQQTLLMLEEMALNEGQLGTADLIHIASQEDFSKVTSHSRAMYAMNRLRTAISHPVNYN